MQEIPAAWWLLKRGSGGIPGEPSVTRHVFRDMHSETKAKFDISSSISGVQHRRIANLPRKINDEEICGHTDLDDRVRIEPNDYMII